MLNVERLRVLSAVATHGSVSAAAAALHVTTSAVSQQVAKLERETGERLLEPHGRGVRLTDAADRLVGHAGRILALVEQAEVELEAQRGSVAGRLAVAAFPTAARGLAPQALRVLAERHPDLVASLRELEPDDAIRLVERGEIDLALAHDWQGAPLAVSPELDRAPLLDDVADVALAADHPLAGRERLDLEELAHEPWIVWDPGTECHDWLVQTLRSRGFEPDVRHVAHEHQTQLALVAAGLGAAVSPRLGREPVPAGVALLPIEPALVRQVYAVWRGNAARRPAIVAAVDAFRNAPPSIS